MSRFSRFSPVLPKKDKVPDAEIDRAVRRKSVFRRDPDAHSHFQGDNLNDTLRAQNINYTKRERWDDLHFDLGGPIMKNKFWWYTALGYQYDGYEKPPQPRTLTTDEIAERERVYKALHERALGGPAAGPHSSKTGGGQQ